jgi:hypothetical protein
VTKPEYLICYYPYSKPVNRIYKVIGDTDCYWKVRYNEHCIGYVNKRTLRSKGGDTQYYVWTKEEVDRYVYRNGLEKAFEKIEVSDLSVEQLENILKIVKE